MEHKRVLLEVLFPVSTPLKADCWKSSLCDAVVLDLFVEVPKGLRSSFDIGISFFSLDCSFSLPNHFRSSEAQNFIVAKYSAEVAMGRVSPEFHPHIAE